MELLFAFLWALVGEVGEGHGGSDLLDRRIEAVTARVLYVQSCTDHDTPWEVAHYVLAAGKDATVLLRGKAMPAMAYLCLQAKGKDGSPLFAGCGGGALRPVTEKTATLRYQDHRNQFLAMMVQTMSPDAPQGQRPMDVPPELWQAILAGAWADFSLQDEPSWTLICYVRLLRALPAPPDQVLQRIGQMVAALTDPGSDRRTACEGSHALQALAVYLNSPWASQMPAELNDRARAMLQRALGHMEDWKDERENAIGDDNNPWRLSQLHAAIGRFGHRLEWVVEYRSAEDLMDVDGVWLADRTCQMLDKALAFEFEDRGGILHAVHGLRMYAAKISTGRATAGHNRLP